MARAAVSSSCDARDELPHVAIFPFMAKGHTIPVTHLAHLLLRRRLAAVTFFTTLGNAAFVRVQLPADASVVELPFPSPESAESVEGLASASSFAAFAEAASALRPRFEEALASMRRGVPVLDGSVGRRARHPEGVVPGHVRVHARHPGGVRARQTRSRRASGHRRFPHVRFLLGDLPPLPVPMLTLDAKMAMAVARSRGVIMNTFRKLESRYVEHWDRHVVGPRAFPIGPLCLGRQSSSSPVDHHPHAESPWMRWLDEKAAVGQAVLFVALVTLFAVPDAQLKEVADGLEQAEVNFLGYESGKRAYVRGDRDAAGEECGGSAGPACHVRWWVIVENGGGDD